MKKSVILPAALGFSLAVLVCLWHGARLAGETRLDSLAKAVLKFTNGQWFDGQNFQSRTFYSVDGALTSKKPLRVDEVIDLKNGYVVPPFGDAHNHYIAGSHDINKILDQYLGDGIFYAKNPASIHRDTEQIKNLINKPDSVDVIFANAGLTASGGHPVRLYDKILIKVKTPGPDGNFENLAYYIINNKEDPEQKWPLIIADHPDFIKTHLLYSEEFEKRRDDPAYYGNKGLDPKLLPLIVAKAHADGLRVACHIETAADFRSALAAGIDEIAHIERRFSASTEWKEYEELLLATTIANAVVLEKAQAVPPRTTEAAKIANPALSENVPAKPGPTSLRTPEPGPVSELAPKGREKSSSDSRASASDTKGLA